MRFRLVPKSVTLNDLERRNVTYFALFSRNQEVSSVDVGAGLYMYDVVVKQFTFTISYLGEFLVIMVALCNRADHYIFAL